MDVVRRHDSVSCTPVKSSCCLSACGPSGLYIWGIYRHVFSATCGSSVMPHTEPEKMKGFIYFFGHSLFSYFHSFFGIYIFNFCSTLFI